MVDREGCENGGGAGGIAFIAVMMFTLARICARWTEGGHVVIEFVVTWWCWMYGT
jgi:hypothetical protein